VFGVSHVAEFIFILACDYAENRKFSLGCLKSSAPGASYAKTFTDNTRLQIIPLL